MTQTISGFQKLDCKLLYNNQSGWGMRFHQIVELSANLQSLSYYTYTPYQALGQGEISKSLNITLSNLEKFTILGYTKSLLVDVRQIINFQFSAQHYSP